MILETFPVGALGCNCSILGDEKTGRAVVIDPGDDLQEIQTRLKRHNLTVEKILHTHTHIDHVGATGELQKATGAEALIHEADRFLYDILGLQASLIGLPMPAVGQLEGKLADESVVRLGDYELQVLHTPGHSPGSVCFELRGAQQPIVFSGDTLFCRGIGRTDLWGGDSEAILRSIQHRLYCLHDETRVIPGHGQPTTIGSERRANPYVRLRTP